MKQMKGFIAGFIFACLLVVPTTALADNVQAQFNTVNITVDGKNAVKQGENFQLSDGSMVPFSITYKGTTYLPVRKVSELLALGIDYDNPTKTVNVVTSNANNTKNQTPSTTTNQTTNDQNKTNQQAANPTDNKTSATTDKTTKTDTNKTNAVTQDLKVASTGYGVINGLSKDRADTGQTVQCVVGYNDNSLFKTYTSGENIVNGWKEVEWNKDGCKNSYLYKFDFASNGVIVGTEKVQSSIGPTKIDAVDRKVVTLDGRNYTLADNAVIYEVDQKDEYKLGAIYRSNYKYLIQLFDTDSSKEGYEYAIISDYE